MNPPHTEPVDPENARRWWCMSGQAEKYPYPYRRADRRQAKVPDDSGLSGARRHLHRWRLGQLGNLRLFRYLARSMVAEPRWMLVWVQCLGCLEATKGGLEVQDDFLVVKAGDS